MAHGVLIPVQIAAMNIDSLNRSVIDLGASASPIDNGNIFALGSEYSSGSLIEVFELAQPSSASGTNLWMAYSGDEVIITDAKYKGLDPDPRNFWTPANKVFSAYKPQVGDIITVTADCFSNSRTAETFAAPILSSFLLKWETNQATSGLCYKLLSTTYISLATGAIDSQRVSAFKLECVSI